MSRLLVTYAGAPVGVNMLNGGIILALMIVPIIVSIGEDALKAVTDSYREAAQALGANKWQLIYRVLLPAAKNGYWRPCCWVSDERSRDHSAKRAGGPVRVDPAATTGDVQSRPQLPPSP